MKGDHVAFSTAENPDPRTPDLQLPPRYGIVHDPKGEVLPRCVVYFASYRVVKKRAVISPEAKKYFGAQYEPDAVQVTRPPRGAWGKVALVTRIFYVRGRRKPNARAPGGYHHSFAGQPLVLEQSGLFYRLSLTPGSNACIIDDRGFVFP